MSAIFETKVALRARRAHERMHGASTWIEARYMPTLEKVRVNDRELGIVTYWFVHVGKRRLISFEKQIGERT
jgi:hypothetical protein